MKHKFLITLVTAMSLVTTAAVTNQDVQASKSNDIFMQGFWSKHPTRSFKKWRNVVLTSKTKFMAIPGNDIPKDMQLKIYYGDSNLSIPKSRYLSKGTVIKLKEGGKLGDFWQIKTNKLPKYKYYKWYFDDGNIDEIYNFSFATTNSYFGISALFAKPRKVKVTRNVRADKLKMTDPMYKIHSVKHVTVKKGTILKVGAPCNHWNHKIWGKHFKNTKHYIWVINRLAGWYKILK